MDHPPLFILPRKIWNAEPPKSEEPLVTHPVPLVVVTFTDSQECFTKDDCVKSMQELQKRDMANGFPDIKFNFMLGGDGNVYEGRGWNTNNHKPGQEWKEVNGRSIDIAYIGPSPLPGARNYPRLLVKLVRDKLIDFGIKNKYISYSFNRDDEPAPLEY